MVVICILEVLISLSGIDDVVTIGLKVDLTASGFYSRFRKLTSTLAIIIAARDLTCAVVAAAAAAATAA